MKTFLATCAIIYLAIIAWFVFAVLCRVKSRHIFFALYGILIALKLFGYIDFNWWMLCFPGTAYLGWKFRRLMEDKPKQVRRCNYRGGHITHEWVEIFELEEHKN